MRQQGHNSGHRYKRGRENDWGGQQQDRNRDGEYSPRGFRGRFGGQQQQQQMMPEPERPLGPNPLSLISKSYIFETRCELPVSETPCNACSQAKKPCICESTAKLGATPGFEMLDVQQAKTDLNDVRSELDSIDIMQWKAHTARTIKTSQVVRNLRQLSNQFPSENARGSPEMITNAWCKMYEMVRACQLIDISKLKEDEPLRTVHLCECPGAFICSVNHYLQTSPDLDAQPEGSDDDESGGDDDRHDHNEFDPHRHHRPRRMKPQPKRPLLAWKAVSLNPYFEGNDMNAMIDDDIFYRYTHYNWLRGEDDSGNIKSRANIRSFQRIAINPPAVAAGPNIVLPSDKPRNVVTHLAHLVTADGSIDTQYDANQQEAITAGLHFAELVAALHVIGTGGHFVIKMFTLFEHHSLSILALMSCMFEQLMVVKPMMSRDGSGEVYVVGKNFSGVRSNVLKRLLDLVETNICKDSATAIFPRNFINNAFYTGFVDCAKAFSDWQTCAIKANFNLYDQGMTQPRDDFDRNIRKERALIARQFVSNFAIRPIEAGKRLCPETLLTGGQTNSTRTTRRVRVAGLQSDRLEFKEDFDTFQAERSNRAKGNQANTGTEEPLKKSQFGLKMMEKMGHKQGEGLGISGQGITEPVELKTTIAKKGLRTSADSRLLSRRFSMKDLSRNTYLLTVDAELLCMFQYFLAWVSFDDFLTRDEDNRRNLRRRFAAGAIDRSAYESEEKRRRGKKEELVTKVRQLGTNTDHREWVTLGAPLDPSSFRISRFVEENLLTKLIRIRLYGDAGNELLVPLTTADCWIMEGGSSRLMKPIQAATDEDSCISTAPCLPGKFPTSQAVQLLMVISNCLKLSQFRLNPANVTASSRQHYIAHLLQTRLRSFTEITGDANFPLTSLLRPLGIKSHIVFANEKLVHEYSTRSDKKMTYLEFGESRIAPRLPGTGPLEFCAPYYRVGRFLDATNMLALVMRVEAKMKSDLVFIDPEDVEYNEQPIQYREFAAAELHNSKDLLSMVLVGLRLLARGGDLIIKFRSIVTRVSATLILLLSYHFEDVVANRPSSVASWSSIRYVVFRCAKESFSKTSGKPESPVPAYLMWAWNRSIGDENRKVLSGAEIKPVVKPPTRALMQLLPPRCFTDSAFITWITDWNTTLDEEELEERISRSRPDMSAQAFGTREERQASCETFLDDNKIRGFFYPNELTESEMKLPEQPTQQTDSRFVRERQVDFQESEPPAKRRSASGGGRYTGGSGGVADLINHERGESPPSSAAFPADPMSSYKLDDHNSFGTDAGPDHLLTISGCRVDSKGDGDDMTDDDYWDKTDSTGIPDVIELLKLTTFIEWMEVRTACVG